MENSTHPVITLSSREEENSWIYTYVYRFVNQGACKDHKDVSIHMTSNFSCAHFLLLW